MHAATWERIRIAVECDRRSLTPDEAADMFEFVREQREEMALDLKAVEEAAEEERAGNLQELREWRQQERNLEARIRKLEDQLECPDADLVVKQERRIRELEHELGQAEDEALRLNERLIDMRNRLATAIGVGASTDAESAIRTAFLAPNGATWSDGAIASQAGHPKRTKLAARIRRQLEEAGSIQRTARRRGLDGRIADVSDCGMPGKRRKAGSLVPA